MATSPQRQRPLKLVPTAKITSPQWSVNQGLTNAVYKTVNPISNCKRSPSLTRTERCWSLFLSSFCFIDSFIYATISIFWKKKVLHPWKKTGVILHPYLPIMATPFQWPLSSAPKVTVVERSDCRYKVNAGFFMNSVTLDEEFIIIWNNIEKHSLKMEFFKRKRIEEGWGWGGGV